MRAALLSLAGLLLAGLCQAAPEQLHETMVSGGTAREYYWHLPEGIDPTPATVRCQGSIEISNWSRGRDQTEVEGWKVAAMRHVWPGSFQYLPLRLIGPATYEFDGSEAIWTFFSRHSR